MKENSSFGAYGAYYDLFYGDKPYTAEVEFLDRLIKKYKPETLILKHKIL